jgi:alkanesulfonate monooxygenase SsuD/methylene tetrahydromethanopterin reductase-like flavin-dependent oxidoreductase (luciferase family)
VVPVILLSIAFLLAPLSARADLHVWVGADGTTHVTDDPEKIPPERRDTAVERVEELRALWDDGSGSRSFAPSGMTA